MSSSELLARSAKMTQNHTDTQFNLFTTNENWYSEAKL